MVNVFKNIAENIKGIIKKIGPKYITVLLLVLAVGVILIAVRAQSTPGSDFGSGSISTQDPETTPDPDPTPDQTPDPEETPEPEPEETPEPEPDEEDEPAYNGPFNPLTGLPISEDWVDNRPLAIVISNEPLALPANGVSQVDILYEYLAYVGATRMLGIFQEFTDIDRVGSIRSARHNVIQLAESYDALFIHHGRSERARIEFTNSNVTHFDASLDFRDSDRVPGRRMISPHNAVTSSAYFAREISKSIHSNIRIKHNEGYDQELRFTDNATPSSGGIATKAVVRYSSTRTSTLTYSETDNIYHMSMQFNNSQYDLIDANNNLKPEFANVLIIKTRITTVDSGPDRLPDFETVGSGDGYYLHGGRYIEIKWSRSNASRSSPYVYTNLDGTPLEMGRGATFISIVSTSHYSSNNTDLGPNAIFS